MPCGLEMSNNNSSECYHQDSLIVFKAYAVVNVLMGIVACFLATFVLSILFLLGKHFFYYQRLIMYLNVSVILGGIVAIISINPFLTDDSGILAQSTFCTINGYLFNWSILTQSILIWWISVDTFIMSMRNNILFEPRNSISVIEIVAVLITFLLPPLLLWVPALPTINQYGPDGPFCDIQKYDYERCEKMKLGYVLLGVYRLLPLIISIIILPALVVISVVKIKMDLKKIQYNTLNDCQRHEIAKTKHTVLQLQVYPLLYVIFSAVPVIYFIADADLDHLISKYILYFLYLLIGNFRAIAVSLAFAFDSDTRSRLKKMNLILFRVSDENRVHSIHQRNLTTSYGDSLNAVRVMRVVQLHHDNKELDCKLI